MRTVVVRKETKNKWERRTALTPESVQRLSARGVPMCVEESPIRVYPDKEYQELGATLVETTAGAGAVAGIKEPPLDTVLPGQIHLCFSHTIKGQPYNMPLLRSFLERGATLIDYEPMIDDHGRRIASVFSRFAGISGTIETLVAAAEKLALSSRTSTLSKLEQPWRYGRLAAAERALESIAPLEENLRVLIVGRGNVGQGCRFVCERLGLPELEPAALDAGSPEGPWFCVVDAPEIVRARDGRPFDFPTYVELGSELFESTFERLLGKFDVLLQGAYWDERYPRQLPLETIVRRAADLPWMIGDISCDIDGTLACTTRATSIDEPVFTFDTTTRTAVDGLSWNGPSVMAVDNLPCELPADASDEFSNLLEETIPFVAAADLSKPLEQSGLSPELQRGTIVFNGELTAPFRYLSRYL